MRAIRRVLLAVLVLLGTGSIALAKNAGDLLKQYVENPRVAVKDEVLALVEIVSINTDATPEGEWKQTGTLRLKLIEVVGGELPQEFTVRFFKRDAEGEDAWTWDHVTLSPGKRLLGFFNRWDGRWDVRKDGRTNVINNPERIADDLIKRAQPLFKSALRPKADEAAQNKAPEDTARKLADPQR